MKLFNNRAGQEAANPEDTHPVDQVLPVGSMVVYGLQHVMSMYAGVVAVPLVVGQALGLSFSDLAYLLTAALLVSGLATLLQTLGIWRIGARLPLVQGTSFAAVASMLAIGKDAGGGTQALQVIFGAILVAGLIGFLLSGVFQRLLHYFPPVVTGSIITVIGISLLPVAIKWAGGGSNTEAPTFGTVSNIGLAGFTLLVILLIYRFLPTFFSRIAILVGLVVGAGVAAALGKADFSQVGSAPWFAVSTPFHFGPPLFNIAAIISMTIVMLVIMTETTADILAIGEVVGRPADGRAVVGGLRADCLATAVSGGLLNSFSASAFAQNVGLVAITGIKSRFVVATSGVILVVLGLFPKVGAIVAAIPLPVLGGAGIALFATVAASGIRALSRVDYDGNNNLVIVAIAVGMGVIPIAVPTFYEQFPSWFQTIFDSGISSAAVTAVLLNLLFNVRRSGKRREAAIFAEAPTPGVTPDYDVPGGRVPAAADTHDQEPVLAASGSPGSDTRDDDDPGDGTADGSSPKRELPGSPSS